MRIYANVCRLQYNLETGCDFLFKANINFEISGRDRRRYEEIS